MTIKLKTSKNEYKTDTERTSFGVIEDTIGAIDFDEINDHLSLAKVVLEALPKLKPILFRLFTDITEEEIAEADDDEIALVFMQILIFAVEEFGKFSDSGKKQSYSQIGEKASMFDVLFSITYSICKDFAINPIEFRKDSASEVFLFIRRWIKEKRKTKNPDVIKVQASDNWF